MKIKLNKYDKVQLQFGLEESIKEASSTQEDIL